MRNIIAHSFQAQVAGRTLLGCLTSSLAISKIKRVQYGWTCLKLLVRTKCFRMEKHNTHTASKELLLLKKGNLSKKLKPWIWV